MRGRKRETFLFVEECMRNIQHEKDVQANARLIENAVKREYNIQVKINIINNKKEFFGMCVYPSPEEIEKMTEVVMFSDNFNYRDMEKLHKEFMIKGAKVVEIDSMLLYDQNINATPGEITAIFLHELGHVVASNSMVNKFIRLREYMDNKFDSKTRRIISEMRCTVFMRGLFNVLTLQIFSHQLNMNLIKEKEADDLALKEGYGPELVSILNKLITNGKGSKIKRTEREKDKDVEITVDWVVANIKELEFRRDRLKRSILFLKMNTPSIYLSTWMEKIHDNLFGKDDRNMVQKALVINEAFILSNLKNKKMKAPSGAMDSSGRVKKLNPRDLDIYRAELERVNTVDDKIFLLERLYDLLDVAEYAKYMLQEDPRRVMQSEVTIDNYIKMIHELIADTNAKYIGKEKYGLFVKYPADFEG